MVNLWLVGLLAAFFGISVGYLLSRKNIIAVNNELNLIRHSYSDIEAKLHQINSENKQYKVDKEASIRELAISTQKNIDDLADKDRIESDLKDKEHSLEVLQKEFYAQQNDLNKKIISLNEKNQTLQRDAFKKEEDLKSLQKEFSIQFENLANRIFEDKSNAFQKQSSKTLEQALLPVKDSFGEFKNKMHEALSKHNDEQISLKAQIEQICILNQNMSLQTENLTKALKGDNKIQGNWGEMVLERLLEESGLVKGRDYVLQGEGLGLKHDETDKHQRPDVIVNLPDDKHLIIDSKVSLIHYERLVNADEEGARNIAQALFIKSIRQHIKDLSSKEYQDNHNLSSPDFTLLFVPIEGAYCSALQFDNELHNFAWSKRIALVSTSTLFATLKTVSSIWRIEDQNKNAEEIAIQAGKIYDKVYGFLTDIEKVGEHIKRTQDNYDSAINKLSKGRGNILSQSEKIKKMGAITKKNISKDIKIAAGLLENV